jgi:succinyl-CoA synthetase beta subunit
MPKNLGLEENAEELREVFRKIYKICVEKDADMVEINPMVKLKENKIMAIDGKVTIDDNAAFRQKDLAASEDKSSKNEKELAAAKWDLNYIHLGGNIGCLVNGAGLAMSTMDIVKMYGGSPSNFLDVGGGATGPAMVEAMKLVHNDEEVDAIFVNIFGGILKCDELVKSVIEAH